MATEHKAQHTHRHAAELNKASVLVASGNVVATPIGRQQHGHHALLSTSDVLNDTNNGGLSIVITDHEVITEVGEHVAHHTAYITQNEPDRRRYRLAPTLIIFYLESVSSTEVFSPNLENEVQV